MLTLKDLSFDCIRDPRTTIFVHGFRCWTESVLDFEKFSGPGPVKVLSGAKFETNKDSIRESYQDYNPSYRSPSFAEDHPRNRRRNDSRDSRRNSFRAGSELSQRKNSRISFYSKENSPRRKSSSPEDL